MSHRIRWSVGREASGEGLAYALAARGLPLALIATSWLLGRLSFLSHLAILGLGYILGKRRRGLSIEPA